MPDLISPWSGTYEGIFHFPLPLFVQASALGKEYQVTIDSIDGVIILPSLDSSSAAENPQLLPPDPSDSRIVDFLHNFRWGYVSIATTLSSYVDNALIRLFPTRDVAAGFHIEGGELLDTPAFKAIGKALRRWFRTACDWLEVWTGQTLNDSAKSEAHDSILHMWEEYRGGLQPYGSGATLGTVYLQFSNVAADRKTLRNAFRFASEGTSLPIEHKLARDARLALSNGDLRRAVIDAGTAAEVTIAKAIRAALLRTNTPDTIEGILGLAQGLSDLFRLHQGIGGESAVSRNRAMNQLMRPRNLAVHAADIPDYQTAVDAVQVARELVEEHSPLPTP